MISIVASSGVEKSIKFTKFDKSEVMSTAEMKLDVITKISKLKNTKLIEEIKNLLDFELDKGIFKLNDVQKNRIIEAQSDKILTEEQANKGIEQWLQEK